MLTEIAEVLCELRQLAYKEVKRRVLNYEHKFQKKYNRPPTKEDIRQRDVNIRGLFLEYARRRKAVLGSASPRSNETLPFEVELESEPPPPAVTCPGGKIVRLKRPSPADAFDFQPRKKRRSSEKVAIGQSSSVAVCSAVADQSIPLASVSAASPTVQPGPSITVTVAVSSVAEAVVPPLELDPLSAALILADSAEDTAESEDALMALRADAASPFLPPPSSCFVPDDAAEVESPSKTLANAPIFGLSVASLVACRRSPRKHLSSPSGAFFSPDKSIARQWSRKLSTGALRCKNVGSLYGVLDEMDNEKPSTSNKADADDDEEEEDEEVETAPFEGAENVDPKEAPQTSRPRQPGKAKQKAGNFVRINMKHKRFVRGKPAKPKGKGAQWRKKMWRPRPKN